MSAVSPTTRRWMSPPPHYDAAQITREGTTLTPYLTLPYLLSLTWLAYPIISLLFVAFRLALSSSSAQDSVDDAKATLLASCSAAEKAATTAASLPRYMAIGTNKQIAAAVNDTMNAARAALVLSLTIMEGIINFVIDIYRSTFLCFLELIVRGSLAVLIDAVQAINSFLSSTFSSIRTSIQNDISSINSAIQSAVDGINKINPLGNISAPQISVPDLSALENVTLPDSVQQGLTSLNSSLPTLDQLRDTIKDFVDTPFEDLKADINNTFAGLNFNASTLAVPDQETLSFCGDMDTSVVDDLGHDLVKITKIGIVILVILALLLIAAHCALEWYKWRCLQQHLEYTRQAWVTDPTMNNAAQNGETPTMRMTNHNLLILSGSQQHPLLTRIANQLAALLKLTPSQHTNLQWFFHYVFHPPALAVFLIGFLGLLSVEIQLLAVHPIEQKYSQQVASSVSDFSNTIATSMNASMFNQSAYYADQINSQVNSTQTTINDSLFGWVNGTTTTLNDTLNDFYTDIQTAVNTVFNGTVLNDPIQDFIKCIIGSKVEALENALTFLHDNLVINIPTMNESALVLSQADVDEASKPIADAAVGNGTDGNQGVVGTLVARYVDSLKKERLMFGLFIALWGLVVIIALLIVFWHSYVKPRVDARKQRKFQSTHREFASFITPYKPEAPALAPAPAYTNTTEKNVSADEKTPRPQGEGFFNVNLRLPTTRRYSQEHQHQRSWDSLLDSSTDTNTNRNDNSAEASSASNNSKPSKSKLGISKPRKLMAIGHKAGKERFISDEERARMRDAETNAESGEDEDKSKEVGWMSRLTKAFRGKFSSDEDTNDNTSKSSSDSTSTSDSSNSQSSTGSGSASKQQRQRPNLTIRTSLSNAAFGNISRDRLPTAGDAPVGHSPARVRNNPPSAWSISPQPPESLPWLPNTANTAGRRVKGKPGLGVGIGLGSKPRLPGPGLPASPRTPGILSPPSAGPRSAGAGTNVAGIGIGISSFRTPMPATPRAAATVTPAAAPVQTPFTAQTTQTAQSASGSGVPSYYYHASSLLHYAGGTGVGAGARRESLLPENLLAANPGGGGRKNQPRAMHAYMHARMSSVPLLGNSRSRSSGTGGVAKTRSSVMPAADLDADANPFRTPFDDDARVIPENWPQPPRSNSNSNNNMNTNMNMNTGSKDAALAPGHVTAGTGSSQPLRSPGAESIANPFSPRAF